MGFASAHHPLPPFASHGDQISPLLEDLASNTSVGRLLRIRKIDVQHMITSWKGYTMKYLIEKVSLHAEAGGEQNAARALGKVGPIP